MSLFSRRGAYSFEDQLERLAKHARVALETVAAQSQIALPAEFAQARTAAAGLRMLETVLTPAELRRFVALAFAALGPRGDVGGVQPYLVQQEPAPTVTNPLFAGRVRDDLNSEGVQTIVEPGRLPSRVILEATFIENGRAGLQFTFLDPEERIVYEDGVPVSRLDYIPVAVDALYDPGRRALFVHGGRTPHVTRVTQLVSGALQGAASGAITFDRPPLLTEPVLYAIVDHLGGSIPASELRLFDPTMRPMRYGTTTDEDVRLSDTGQRIKAEGLARDVDANIPHAALVANGGLERVVRMRIEERWGVRLRDPLEPDGYLALFDRVQRWYVAGSWLKPLEMLAREALERRNVAVSQTDITAHARGVRDDIEVALGNLLPAGANLHQRQLLTALAANALVRFIPHAARLRAGANVALRQDLTRFINEHGQRANVTLDAPRRSALVRRVWRALEESNRDLLDFIERVRNVT